MKNIRENDKRRRDILFDRLFWFIQLRWGAALGVIATIFITRRFFHITLPVLQLYSIAAFIILYNTIFLNFILRFKKGLLKYPWRVNLFANIQISLDLTCLAVLVHFSGGIENPFIFYFIFHMIIAGILLKPTAAFLQTTYAIGLFLAVVILEYWKILPHYSLWAIAPYSLHDKTPYVFGVSSVFASTAYIALYMATSISIQLKAKEKNLSEANQLLSENDYIKSKYVLRVTHDIKEDLAAIHSCIEPVVGGITGPLNSNQDDLLQRAKRRSKRLVTFVNSLLDITKIKMVQDLKMEYFSLPELVEDISENIQIRARNKGLSFEAKMGPGIADIKGVRVYIQELVNNLLTNAIKHTQDSGKVILEVEKVKDSVFIRVIDTGVGIPKEDLPHVFEEFYQAQNVSRQKRQGAGLGLSIVKEIANLHNGKVTIQSEERKGTTVSVELPSCF